MPITEGMQADPWEEVGFTDLNFAMNAGTNGLNLPEADLILLMKLFAPLDVYATYSAESSIADYGNYHLLSDKGKNFLINSLYEQLKAIVDALAA